jgi:hypothetical protein
MSQIATAYALPAAVLAEAVRHVQARDSKRFHDGLHPYEIERGFPFGGEVVAVLAEYLREHGAALPVSHEPTLQPLMAQFGPLVCARPPEVAVAAATLAHVRLSDGEMVRFWQDWTGETDPDVAGAFRVALEWLRRVLATGQASDWCLVLVG